MLVGLTPDDNPTFRMREDTQLLHVDDTLTLTVKPLVLITQGISIEYHNEEQELSVAECRECEYKICALIDYATCCGEHCTGNCID